ncbi:MAG: DUF4038 domain-containing protein [Anaerolineaceae bacterium]|nr:DUF4038 domain-containing protein [Anaerolineaceae bacterium]
MCRTQEFSFIQAVVLAELAGLRMSNASKHIMLCSDAPTLPNAFDFRRVDIVIRLVAQKSLRIGLLSTWGDKMHGGICGVGPGWLRSILAKFLAIMIAIPRVTVDLPGSVGCRSLGNIYCGNILWGTLYISIFLSHRCSAITSFL